MSAFTDFLQQASFRGVPFAVVVGESRHGRRLAVHEYPKRDKPWAEDMGRSTRPFTIAGFLITDSAIYGGGDVNSQYKALAGAAEQSGTGTLVHPILGELTVSIPDGGLSVVMSLENGSTLQFNLSCIESGDRRFPSDAQDTGQGTHAAADSADEASGSDFGDDVAGALTEGSVVFDMAAATAQSFVSLVQMGANDATGIFNWLVDLPGNFGRYFAGATQGFATPAQLPASTATISSLIAQNVASQIAISAASATLVQACSGTDPGAMAAASQGVAASLLSACADPADAIRILTNMANFYPAVPTPPSVTGMAAAIMQTALGALFRRSMMTALARASALYQPSSSTDAANLRGQLDTTFSAEIDIAGDTPDDATFLALRQMRAAVILDLNTRGGALPVLETFNFPAPLPACVLAQMLYQDPSRTDELIVQIDPIHPAFCPPSFQALSS